MLYLFIYMDTEGRCQAEVLDNQSLHFCILYRRKYSSLPWYQVHLEKNIPFTIYLFLRCVGTPLTENNNQENSTKINFKRKNKIFKLVTCSLPFFCHITRSLSEDFPFLFQGRGPSKVFPMSCSVLPQLLGHGNNLPWSAVGSPCKAQQGPAWSPTLAQARLSKEDSNHHRKHSYHSATESPLSSCSTSWASISELLRFLKECGTRGIGSGSSWV